MNTFSSTTAAGGTNLAVSNMSTVEIGNAIFSASGANVGIVTLNGGFVGKKAGTALINSATTPTAPTSCAITTGTPINCSYAAGTIVVTP